MALAARVLVAIAALVCLSTASNYPPCCFDPVLGHVDNSTCTCLGDDTLIFSNATAGGTRRFHWALTAEDNDLITAPDDKRKLSFHLSPCRGSVRLLVNSVAQGGFPDNATAEFRSDNLMDDNILTVHLEGSQFFVVVLAEAESVFTISAVTMRGVAPEPGANGTLTAFTPPPDRILRAGEPMEMALAFRTPPQPMEYQVLLVPHVQGPGPCAEPQRSQKPEGCIISTYCGAMRVGTPVFAGFQRLPPASSVVLTVPGLPRDVEHAFQLVARNLSIPGNITRTVYTATQGTPTFTREVMAQSTTVVMIILLTAASIMVGLILCVVITKRQIKVQYQKLAAREVPTAPSSIVGGRREEDEEELGVEFA